MIVCDGCKVKRQTGPTARAARHAFLMVHGGMAFVQPGNRDYCQVCVEADKHLQPPRRKALFTRAGRA